MAVLLVLCPFELESRNELTGANELGKIESCRLTAFCAEVASSPNDRRTGIMGAASQYQSDT